MARLKHVAEYVLLRTVAGLCCRLPYRAALAVGWVLAGLFFFVCRFRRREAERRIVSVLGPDLPPRRRRYIAWRSFRNLCFNVVEIARMPITTAAAYRTEDNVTAMDHLRAIRADGRGVVLAVPHMGNWDLAGVAAHRLGVPVFFLARRQKNPLVDDYLNRMRGTTGVDTLLTDDARLGREVVRRLKSGKVFAMLPDIRARVPDLATTFLGQPANLASGMATFARLARVPILPVVLLRTGWTRHQWIPGPLVHPDPALDSRADVLRMTRLVLDYFEPAIRAQPEQYFWYNKRWVLEPLAPPADNPPAQH